MTDQAKTVEDLISGITDDPYEPMFRDEVIGLIHGAVALSRASQGSRVGTEEEVERVARAIYAARYDGEYARVPWVIDAANKAIAVLSPPATPQAPEDVLARAIELMLPYLEESEAMIGAAVDELSRAHLLATPVTVTEAQCQEILEALGADEVDGQTISGFDLAIELRRVLGRHRILIEGKS